MAETAISFLLLCFWTRLHIESNLDLVLFCINCERKTKTIYSHHRQCTVKKKTVKNTVNPRVTFCPLNGAVKIDAICCVLSLTSGLL